MAWGDYDNDGRLDILLTGWDAPATQSEGLPQRRQRYLPRHLRRADRRAHGSVAWGDYDNNGRLDILLTGLGQPTAVRVTKLYRNDGERHVLTTSSAA